MAETAYYIIGEGLAPKDGVITAKTTHLTSDLSSLYKSNDLFISTLEEWTETVLASPALQTALKFTLAVASDEDLAAFGPDLRIISAVDKVKAAKAKAAQEELEGKTETVEYFSDTVTTEAEAKSFLSRFKLNANQMSHWITLVQKTAEETESGWVLAPESAKALAATWHASGATAAAKKVIAASEQYKKVMSWAK